MSYQFPALVTPLPAAATVDDDPGLALGHTLRLSLVVVGALVAALLLMGTVVRVSGAVIGSGRLAVATSVRRVAHPTGGVIAQVFVKEGDRVRKGEPILRFDNRVTDGSATMLGQTVEQLLANQARLIAERDGAAAIAFPPSLANNPSLSARAAMEETRRQFALRRQLRQAEANAARERVRQVQQQIASVIAQRGAASRQVALVRPELNAMRELYGRGLVTLSRMNQTERTAVELEGTVSSHDADIAQMRARIAELNQAALEAEQTTRTQAAQELAAIHAQLADQSIRSLATADAADRSLLRAPYAGIVEKLDIAAVGGVVAPAQPVAEIVPDGDPLIVEAMVSPNDIDQLHRGQRAVVRFSGLNRQTTPEVLGEVYFIATEPTVNERTGASFFTVKVRVAENQLRRLGDVSLKSGMPAETFFETGRRSLLSYLFKPLIDQLNRAFRD